MNLDIRTQFPILAQFVNELPLVYFDNAATTQKPLAVLQAVQEFYQEEYANIHRGVHWLSERATKRYESVRQKVSRYIHASEHEVIFTSGTTSGLNFLARGLVEPMLQQGDILLTTALEHHSNLVPWQMVAQRTGARLEFLPLTKHYQVDIAALEQLDTSRIKAIAIHHVSNVLGVAQPIRAIVDWAKQYGILVVVDGAQAIAHCSVNVKQLGVDAYCFSGHKLYAPTGVGVCYLHERWHEVCQPVLFGGEMIHVVDDTTSTFKQSPWKFEAGTPPIAQVVGLGAAIDYVELVGMERIEHYEQQLLDRLVGQLNHLDGVTVYGYGNGIVSYNIEGVHPHDAATAYDMEGIAVRAGHHCAQPLMRRLNVSATLRASVAMYNTVEEVEHFIAVTKKIKEYFADGIG